MIILCLLKCPSAYLRLPKDIDDSSRAARLSFPTADRRRGPRPAVPRGRASRGDTRPPSIHLAFQAHAAGAQGPEPARDRLRLSKPRDTQIEANLPGMLRSRSIFGSGGGVLPPGETAPGRRLRLAQPDEIRRGPGLWRRDITVSGQKYCVGGNAQAAC